MFYNYDHENPNAPERSNGLRFWGYPQRTKPISMVVIHTAETLPDRDGEDTKAEAVARYGATTSRPVSWHATVDSDSTILNLPAEAVAFHVRGYNSVSLGIEIATQAHAWGEDKEHDDKLLLNAAKVVGEWCRVHGITPKRIKTPGNGVIAHGDLDPERRSDPGPKFPWRKFIRLVAAVVKGVEPKDPTPAPTPTRPTPKPAPAPKGITAQLDTVKSGSRGADVRRAQALVSLDRDRLAPDGKFGPMTRKAVVGYQTRHGLDPDGVVGPKTWKSLLEVEV